MNLKDLKELIDLVKTSELTELEWERSGTRVRICRSAPPPPRSASAESGVAVLRVMGDWHAHKWQSRSSARNLNRCNLMA